MVLLSWLVVSRVSRTPLDGDCDCRVSSLQCVKREIIAKETSDIADDYGLFLHFNDAPSVWMRGALRDTCFSSQSSVFRCPFAVLSQLCDDGVVSLDHFPLEYYGFFPSDAPAPPPCMLSASSPLYCDWRKKYRMLQAVLPDNTFGRCSSTTRFVWPISCRDSRVSWTLIGAARRNPPRSLRPQLRHVDEWSVGFSDVANKRMCVVVAAQWCF